MQNSIKLFFISKKFDKQNHLNLIKYNDSINIIKHDYMYIYNYIETKLFIFNISNNINYFYKNILYIINISFFWRYFKDINTNENFLKKNFFSNILNIKPYFYDKFFLKKKSKFLKSKFFKKNRKKRPFTLYKYKPLDVLTNEPLDVLTNEPLDVLTNQILILENKQQISTIVKDMLLYDMNDVLMLPITSFNDNVNSVYGYSNLLNIDTTHEKPNMIDVSIEKNNDIIENEELNNLDINAYTNYYLKSSTWPDHKLVSLNLNKFKNYKVLKIFKFFKKRNVFDNYEFMDNKINNFNIYFYKSLNWNNLELNEIFFKKIIEKYNFTRTDNFTFLKKLVFKKKKIFLNINIIYKLNTVITNIIFLNVSRKINIISKNSSNSYKNLFLYNCLQNSIINMDYNTVLPKLNYGFANLLTSGTHMYVEPYRLHMAGTIKHLFPYTNFYPVYFLGKTHKLYIMQLFDLKRTPVYANYYFYFLITFLENFLGNKIWFKCITKNTIHYAIANLLDYTFYQNRSEQKGVEKKFFLNECYDILYLSFKNRDLVLLAMWFKKIMEKLELRKHKKIVKIIQSTLQKYEFFFKLTGVTGFYFDIRGKLGVSGNAKKRHYAFSVGLISSTQKSLKLKFCQTTIRTDTGVMGVNFLISY